MADNKTPARTNPSPIDVLRRIDKDMAVRIDPERRVSLVMEVLEHGDMKTATPIERRVLLLDPDFLYVFTELKKREAEVALLTTGVGKLAEDLHSDNRIVFLEAYDRLSKRAERGSLVNININASSGKYEEMLSEAAKKNGDGK